jgi:hypothetical protein
MKTIKTKRNRILSTFVVIAVAITMVTSVPINPIIATANTGVLLMSITQNISTTAQDGNKFTADIGFGELTAWDNNTQISIGGTGRTPIVINNAALTGSGLTPPRGWQPASVAGINNAPAFQIKFNTLGYNDLRFSCLQKSTGSGPDTFKLAYRIGNSGNFIPINGSTVTPPRISNDSYAALEQTYHNFSLPAAINNQTEVYLRVYFDGSANLGRNGNTSINDIKIASGEYDFDNPVMPPDRNPRPEHIIINQFMVTELTK